MKKQFMNICLLSLVAGVIPAVAAQTCKPVVGSFEATIVQPGKVIAPLTRRCAQRAGFGEDFRGARGIVRKRV
jgi:hypothetical protein